MRRIARSARPLAALQLSLVLFVCCARPCLAQADQPNDAPAALRPHPASHHRHRHHRAAPAAAPTDASPAASVPTPPPVPLPAIVQRQPAAIGTGDGLTAMGAIQAGNAEGTIPAWTGGLVGPPSNRPVRFRPDPFGAERRLFSITAATVDRYADRLAAGTAAMIRTLPGYHVDVYPTHRTFAAPQYIYDNATANRARARLLHGGQGIEGAVLSIPFPVPHGGAEAMWNELLRWRGTQIIRNIVNVISTPGGSYSLQKWHEDIMLPYNTAGFNNAAAWDSMFRQEVVAPPRDAGALTLVINHEDPYDHPREAWSYNPGERRVRRAPDLDYDTPLTDTDGLETVDDYDLFNGALDRYDWTLVGRREIYVPYNSNRLQDPAVHITDLVGRDAINPDYLRFELHRVWVVDGRLKREFRHIYTRRTLYLDEDSWQALISDRYDGRGNLWRTAMAFPIAAPEVPVLGADAYEYVDLYQHRYLMQGLHNQEAQAPVFNAASLSPRDFTADALRRMGYR